MTSNSNVSADEVSLQQSDLLVLISEYEEHLLLEKLGRYIEMRRKGEQVEDEVTSEEAEEELKVRRLYRKLVVRKAQKRNNVEHLDLHRDMVLGKVARRGQRVPGGGGGIQRGVGTFERYKGLLVDYQLKSPMLVPDPRTQKIVSSYTGRTLKPFVRREFEMESPKLKLHSELIKRVSKSPTIQRHPLDFCYVQRQHVQPVNILAANFFWPGIDVSEALEYPDFSCVAMYRQLVVGFAFLIPNVSHTEAYITFIFVHPDWRGSGIAKFFLYHLIQTCAGKDIILHVSANNPAVMLYQKFGFKVEERIAGFYEKYLPAESRECRDALFLRLAR